MEPGTLWGALSLYKNATQIQSIIIRHSPQKHSQNVVKPDQKLWNASSYLKKCLLCVVILCRD